MTTIDTSTFFRECDNPFAVDNILFFVGLHQPHDAQHFLQCCISVHRLARRKSAFDVGEWVMDSGAWTTLSTHGAYPTPVAAYAAHIRRWSTVGMLQAAVAQDYMCEPAMLRRTGLSVQEHQRMTIERYDALLQCDTGGTYVMPVLQGYHPEEYLEHLDQYGSRLRDKQWVGVGSVCKRNASITHIEAVLVAIRRERPDLRLHGFGVKTTALRSAIVRRCLHSADSMAWSYAARRAGRNPNSWREAARFVDAITHQPVQGHAFVDELASLATNASPRRSQRMPDRWEHTHGGEHMLVDGNRPRSVCLNSQQQR